MTTPLRHALLRELPSQARTIVRVTGDDALRFLQGLLTADVGELTPGRATPAALLTVKGKIVSELWVLAVGEDEPWLAVPAEIGEAVVAKLDEHIIMDDVELEVLDGLEAAIVWREDRALSRLELAELPEALASFDAVHPLVGVLVVGPRETLVEAGAALGEAVSAEAFTAARIAGARPAWGFELRPDHFPPEVGFVDAVSYDKGCYLGQEPLSRIHNRGQVNWVMVQVALSGPASELPVALREDEREVGRLTSAAGDAGLAIVRRAHAKPGATLRAGGALEVRVTSGPLGDDPGQGGRQTSATVSLGGRR